MATVDTQVNTTTDIYGNTYTTAVANDQLTNNDFLTLMLQELQNQDPTQPSDTDSMLSNQMQMSTIETNNAMIAAMTSLQNSFAQSTMANASNLIGKIVENGDIADNGMVKGWQVSAIESIDGTLYAVGYEILGLTEDGQIVIAEKPSYLAYDTITRINEGIDLNAGGTPPSEEEEDGEVEGEGEGDGEGEGEGEESETPESESV